MSKSNFKLLTLYYLNDIILITSKEDLTMATLGFITVLIRTAILAAILFALRYAYVFVQYKSSGMQVMCCESEYMLEQTLMGWPVIVGIAFALVVIADFFHNKWKREKK